MRRFKNVLFVADTDQDNASALKQALTLCKDNQARLTVISVVPEILHTSMPLPMQPIIDERREWLSQLVDDVDTDGVALEVKVLCGREFVKVINEVLSERRDLVIKAARHDKGVFGYLRGVTDRELLRKCPCPVWLIKSAEQRGGREFVVALDYEPEHPENEALNQQLLEIGTALALSEFAELHVVHAWRLEHEGIMRSERLGLTPGDIDKLIRDEEQRRREGLTELIDKYCTHHDAKTERFLKPQLHLLGGPARTAVPEFAQELGAELVIMGSLGRSGIPGLLIGNTAEVILEQLDSSILAVKPAGFESPVAVDSD